MRKPNIILISIDTFRADYLSCYGYQKTITPNIDKIAAEGTIFLQNYSTGVWTPPGHASMLTGLYVSEHGVYGDNRLHESIQTIAVILKDNGYQTSGFVNNSQAGALVGFDRGHDTFIEIWKGIKPKSTIEWVVNGVRRRIRRGLGYEDMGATKTNKLFKDWMESQIDINRPFFTFLHYIEPHNPLNPPRPYRKKNIKQIFENIDMRKINTVAYNPLICFIENMNLNKDEIEVLKLLYEGEVEYTDNKIGEIISILKRNNVYEDTMIIITSDHGEHFGEHGLWSHTASLYNEVLHVPLIIKFPKGIKYISEVNDCTQLVDIFPTVMDVSGASKDDLNSTSGVSLVYGSSNNTKFHSHIFAEWEGRVPYFIQSRLNDPKSSVDLSRIKNRMWMISDGEYKYILMDNGQEELFDLKHDMNERNNLIDQYKGISAEMKEVLNKWKKSSGNKFNRQQCEVDEETKKNLEALGYM